MTKTLGQLIDNQHDFDDWINDMLASSAALNVVARTKLLDGLDAGPATAGELAAQAQMHEGSVDQVMTYLASQEVVAVDSLGRFSHTERSRKLMAENPRLFLLDDALRSGLSLVRSFGDGSCAFELEFGTSLFAWFSEDPERLDYFARYMSATTATVEDFIFTHHTFEPFALAVDVGGSHGSLMMRLLAEYPQARGIVFDQPDTAAQAEPIVARSPVADRIEIVGGDFFKAVPAGGDLYTVKQILHDWNEQDSMLILRNIRQAIADGGRLAVMDYLLPDVPVPHQGFAMDMQMLFLLSARERKLSQFEALFDACGFKLDRVTENPRGPSVIEAVPV